MTSRGLRTISPPQPGERIPLEVSEEQVAQRLRAALFGRTLGKSWARWGLQLERYVREPKRPPTLAPFPLSPVHAGCIELVCCLHIMQAASPIRIWYDEAVEVDVAAWERLGMHFVRRPGTFVWNAS